MKSLLPILPLFLAASAAAQNPSLNLPPRHPNAIAGSQFAKELEGLPLEQRETLIYEQVEQGNVPEFLRHLVPVEVQEGAATGTIYVAPDILAVGSDQDYFDVPLTPYTAQKIADLTNCSLPTPKMSEEIYAAAPLKMTPSPIPPSSAMTTVPIFEQMNETLRFQRQQVLSQYPLGTLVAGDKKDVVICKELATTPGKVAIYGWQRSPDHPIQPLYLRHTASWADYSHGIRLISRTMLVEGKECDLVDVLQDPVLAGLLSDQGPLSQPRYIFAAFPKDWSDSIDVPADENLVKLFPAPAVRVVIDEPKQLDKKVELVLYALPNGNTIEQTFGKKMQPGMDWHFDIQNIGAQTRFARQRIHGESLVVAYLQTDGRSWPAWFGERSPRDAIGIVSAVLDKYRGHDLSIVLDSHSGGGALLFRYIQAVDSIPDNIDRIAFLDSDYDYDAAQDEQKLAEWLRKDGHCLCVLAYDDASALLNGKPFVTAAGGTWGRTHAMLQNLEKDFDIRRVNQTDPEEYSGLNGRIMFWLKENPNRQIFHTVQVEKNGFIESLFSGTPDEGKGYRYFGERAYSRFVF